jgi:NADP-dependent 3-hydroxy acid dehydrogenase YdfG
MCGMAPPQLWTRGRAEQHRIAFDCNVIAPLDLTQAVIPGMRAEGTTGRTPTMLARNRF